MKNSKIKTIKAREILDSKGNPTVEVDLLTEAGLFQAKVPSGVSTGKLEAVELRDKDHRYLGKGVQKAVQNINEILGPKLKGKDVTKQKEIDELMIKLDATENKSKLGANAILGVSLAVCRAGAVANGLALWKYISHLAANSCQPALPTPCLLMVEGGLHAGNDLDVQEFMIAPEADSYKEKLRMGVEVYHNLASILEKEFAPSATNVGYEGGFAAPLAKSSQALDFVMAAIEKAGYQDKVKIVLDVAATTFYKEGSYNFEAVPFDQAGLLNFYSELIKKYPILAIEDPFAEDDWEGFKLICEKLGKKIKVIGDDFLVTNIERIKKAQAEKACNSLILKANQIGTLTETLEAAKLALKAGWQVFVKHRGGETSDDFIADLSVGLGTGWLMTGAPARGERVAKYNRLLRIEEEIENTSR